MSSLPANTSVKRFSHQPLPPNDDALLTFKEAMDYLRVGRSKMYHLMWSGQLIGHKVGCTWRFYPSDLRACIRAEVLSPTSQVKMVSS